MKNKDTGDEMMSSKRQINHVKFNIEELVDSAIATADEAELDLESASRSLEMMGHRNPSSAIVTRYARERAILETLADATGANFSGQIGKINFSNRTRAIASVNSYLNRRIGGQRARWSGR